MAEQAKVSTRHAEYTANASLWKQVRDCVAGPAAVRNAGETYLPRPNPEDVSDENLLRYAQYLQRALFYPVTQRTHDGLIGAVFRKPPEREVPDSVGYLLEDIDNQGQSVDQLSRWAVGELLDVGRVGMLVEYPQVETGATRTLAQQRASGRRPYVIGYKAEAIINWRYAKVGESVKLSLVVLLEQQVVAGRSLFDNSTETVYRVLALDESGTYYQQLYNSKGEEAGPPVYPRRGDGGVWREIPFAIAGATDNLPDVDIAPLYALSEVNIGHYRNSADYEEAVYLHGQGTLFVSIGQLTPEQFTAANPNGISIGARAGHVLGQGGAAELLQLQPNNAAREAMQDKEQQMIAIGARLITMTKGNKTAEEARIVASGESSVLSSVAGNAGEAIEAALRWCCVFVNVPTDDVLFVNNKEFFDGDYDPQAAIAKMQELDRGLTTPRDYRDWLRRVGALPMERTDELIEDELDSGGGIT